MCCSPGRDVTGPGAVLFVTNTNGGALAGSLRAIVNQTTGGEVIHFDPSIAGSTTTLDTTLEIPNNLTIEGPAGKGITTRAALVLRRSAVEVASGSSCATRSSPATTQVAARSGSSALSTKA